MKEIVFLVPGYEGGAYSSIVDSHIRPVMACLPPTRIVEERVEGALNVSCFTVNKGDVFLYHGLSDKGLRNASSVWHYKYVLVPGPAWYDKMIEQGMPKEKLFTIGYPSLDSQFTESGELTHDASYDGSLVWAPTHTNGFTSYPQLGDVLAEIEHKLPFTKIEVRPHPFNAPANFTTTEELAHASVVIADMGSTMYESWAMGKPVVFPDWIIKTKGGLSIHSLPKDIFEHEIYANNVGRHVQRQGDFVDALLEAHDCGITKEETEFIDRILPPEYRGRSAQMTADLLLDLAKEA